MIVFGANRGSFLGACLKKSPYYLVVSIIHCTFASVIHLLIFKYMGKWI